MISEELWPNTFPGKTRVLTAGLLSVFAVCGLTTCMSADSSSRQTSGSACTEPSTVVDCEYIGAYPSLAVAPDGRLHASYYARFDWAQDGGGALNHAVPEEDGWEYDTVDDTGDVGRTSAIAEDSDGTIHMIYRDSSNNDLKYAYLQ